VRRAAPLVLLLFVACTSGFVFYEKQEADTLYIGTNKVHGGVVSNAEWEQFLKEVVSPRFPGYTHWMAHGVWMNQSEDTHVLVIVHPQGHENAILEIIDEGKKRLDQQEILQVRADAWLTNR
jgi:uncharacterized protein DUF3574